MSGSQGTAKAWTSAVSHSSSVPKDLLHIAANSRCLLQKALSSPIAATASRRRNAGVYRKGGTVSTVFHIHRDKPEQLLSTPSRGFGFV